MSCPHLSGRPLVPHLSQPPTTLKYFDRRTCGILNSLQVELVGKSISIEVEVIDGPPDYIILLVHTRVYTMAIVVSSYFWMIAFPHKGTIVAIDQITNFVSNSPIIGSVPLVRETLHPY